MLLQYMVCFHNFAIISKERKISREKKTNLRRCDRILLNPKVLWTFLPSLLPFGNKNWERGVAVGLSEVLVLGMRSHSPTFSQ